MTPEENRLVEAIEAIVEALDKVANEIYMLRTSGRRTR